ncbi:MAG: serine/threonine protein kinase, partial [Mycobacterium sp.]
LYECLTGSTPYPVDNFEQQITAHLTDPPPRPSSTDPNIPTQVDQVIATGMAKNPDNRYATTIKLASAAHAALTTTTSRAPHTAPSSRADPTRPARKPNLRSDQLPRPPEPEQQRPAYPKLAATQHDLPDRPPSLPPRADDEPTHEPVPSPRPRPRPGIVVVAVAVAILAIGIFAYL